MSCSSKELSCAPKPTSVVSKVFKDFSGLQKSSTILQGVTWSLQVWLDVQKSSLELRRMSSLEIFSWARKVSQKTTLRLLIKILLGARKTSLVTGPTKDAHRIHTKFKQNRAIYGHCFVRKFRDFSSVIYCTKVWGPWPRSHLSTALVLSSLPFLRIRSFHP